MKKIMTVDDHPIVLQSMKTIMEKKGYKVIKATTGTQAATLLSYIDDVDLVICDLSLPDVDDGLKLIQTIKDMRKDVPIIVFTMHEELWNIKTLMELEISGVVLKNDSTNELFQAIDTVLSGNQYFSIQFCKMREKILLSTGILSIKEISILRSISMGMTNPEIAGKMGISEKTIEFHRKNIRQKLGVKTMAEATRKACIMGLLTIIMLLFMPARLHSQNKMDIYRSDGIHHALDDGMVRQISFSDTNGQWTLNAELSADSMLSIPVESIDSISFCHPLLTPGNAVDLGLSVLWANHNLGADRPEAYGGYYAYGETAEKEQYTHENYKHSDDDDHYGFFMHDIGPEISATDMDAAHVLWGNGWRMPTRAECVELAEKCTCKQINYNGTTGMLVIGSNGNRMFFPYAGTKRKLSTPMYANIEGVYISGTSDFETYEGEKFTISIIIPYGLLFNDGKVYGDGMLNASLGYTIRPVHNK